VRCDRFDHPYTGGAHDVLVCRSRRFACDIAALRSRYGVERPVDSDGADRSDTEYTTTMIVKSSMPARGGDAANCALQRTAGPSIRPYRPDRVQRSRR